jgi:hypothetical protein
MVYESDPATIAGPPRRRERHGGYIRDTPSCNDERRRARWARAARRVRERVSDRKERTMSDLENGMMVQHASLGLGKVVAVEPKAVHVFFATSGARFATKLRLPMALPLLTPAASTNAWLSHLSGFVLDSKSGRYGLAGTWLSHADAVVRFTEVVPKGFASPSSVPDGTERRERVPRWRRAHEVYTETLGGGEGERLLAAGDVAGLVERALRVERPVRALHKDAEKASFEDALKDLEVARGYFTALFDLLAAPGPEQSRFEALAAAVAAMPGVPTESGWPLVTLLPFIAQPELHMLLRPRFASEVAHRLGLELAYDPRPNWSTYSTLLRSAEVLLEKLRPLGARDHVDVDSFMHAVTTKHPRPKALLPQLPLAT